jgi:hypothetical protein
VQPSSGATSPSSAPISADTSASKLTGEQRDRLPDEILKPPIAHPRNDLGGRHPLALGHRRVSFTSAAEQPTKFGTAMAEPLKARPPGARYAASTDTTPAVWTES